MLQPPTDNLYKFMAIIGLIIWVGGGWYPWTKAYEVEKELITLEAEIKHAQQYPVQSNPVELEKNGKLVRLFLKATIVYFAIGTFGMMVGGVLMYYGFRFWYIRVQKPLDDQLNKHS